MLHFFDHEYNANTMFSVSILVKLLQSSVSHDPSEIILRFTALETFLLIINVENSRAA